VTVSAKWPFGVGRREAVVTAVTDVENDAAPAAGFGHMLEASPSVAATVEQSSASPKSGADALVVPSVQRPSVLRPRLFSGVR
jgi:hypothetical protein